MEKIENVRNATIESISRNGLANSSVSSIAKIAGVSDGYLYRHYSGKDDLVRDVLEATFASSIEIMEQLLSDSVNIDEYIDNYTYFSISSAMEEPHKFKFLVLVQNDFSYVLERSLVVRMKDFCQVILDKCNRDVNYRRDLSIEDIYMAFIVVPQQYVKLNFKDEFDVQMDLEILTKKIKRMILSIIK